MGHLLSVMLPGVPVACSFPSTYYAPFAHFLLHIPLTPSTFLVASASFTSSLSSALSASLLRTNLARIYYHRECCLSACPTILEPSQ